MFNSSIEDGDRLLEETNETIEFRKLHRTAPNRKSTICTRTPNLKLSNYVCFTLGFQVFSCSIGGGLLLLEETIEDQ